MSSGIRDSAIEGSSVLTFGKKGLIATFYALRGEKAKALHDELKTTFKEEPLKFDPEEIAAHDTTIIQVSLTASGEAKIAWETMRERLENKLTSKMSSNWLGYSL